MGEKRIALTVHLMDDKLDSGDIITKEYLDINDHTKVGDIYNFINKNGPNLFIRALDNLQKNIPTIPQSKDPNLVLRCYPRMPRDNEINWESSAKEIQRLINASSEPFSGAFTYIDFTKIIHNNRITFDRS